ncbi:hypothetical protein XAP3CFBP6996_002295 [Xanthomonas citri pv. fuscans CFBP 6996]|nr:hypothetical protein XAP3CFBP6996_002295 [Xanthomonas citri pv. fuscans CFBP 6996]
MADGGWRMADGRWQMADGRWRSVFGHAIAGPAWLLAAPAGLPEGIGASEIPAQVPRRKSACTSGPPRSQRRARFFHL